MFRCAICIDLILYPIIYWGNNIDNVKSKMEERNSQGFEGLINDNSQEQIIFIYRSTGSTYPSSFKVKLPTNTKRFQPVVTW